jgi:hypothetical protein
MKLKVDEKGVVALENGLPIYEYEDGSSSPFDADTTLTGLNGRIKNLEEEKNRHAARRVDLRQQRPAAVPGGHVTRHQSRKGLGGRTHRFDVLWFKMMSVASPTGSASSNGSKAARSGIWNSPGPTAHRNAQSATAFFHLPANRVVELGMQVEI